ncbi:hypothetical protein LTR40_009853, partial [Exophiala xenobiotica]
MLTTRTVRGRVDNLESSYSEILALLRRNVEAEASPAPSSSLYQPPSIPDRRSQGTRSAFELGGSQSIFPAVVGTEMLPLEECDSLITAYRRMSQTNYPFVILPESCRAASLIEERPMLAQAIFIVTSWRNSARQATLRASFLRDVSDKFLMRSERSLDLLQGLIVYFGWCHFYTITFSSEGYRLATILVTMAIELGITQKPLTVTQHDLLLNSSSIFPQTNEATSSKFWSYEARRAFIAAHIISTFCCLAFRRHSLLPHTQYVEDCASSLATDPQCPSDSLLIYWVKSMALAELVSLTFDHGSRERICELNDDKIQLLVKILVRQLDEWKATLPPPNSTN